MLPPDGYYRQNDGLAMGSPTAGPLANIWSQFEPIIKYTAKIFKRYVDDIIRSIKKIQIVANTSKSITCTQTSNSLPR